MTFDGIITKCVVNELNKLLIGGRIEKITQPSKLELNIHIYNKEKYTLLINCNANDTRINLSSIIKPLPLKAPNFCMCLRKHIQGYKILEIIQYMLDRIILIKLEGYNELNDKEIKYLSIELMGKHSNCILLNDKNLIIDSLRHVDESISSVRLVLPYIKYEYPKTKLDFSNINLSEFNKLALNYDDTTTFLLNIFNGFSKAFVEMILNNVSDNNNSKIYNEIKFCLNNIDNNKFSVINKNNKQLYIDYLSQENNVSINKDIDSYYLNYEIENTLNLAKENLIRIINNNITKLNKNLKIVNKNLMECENIEKYRIYGELITSNLYKNINTSDTINVENYYDNNNIISIPIDKTISLNKNAQKYFKKYSKLKNTYNYSINKKVDIENEIDYLQSVIYNIQTINNINEISAIKKELINQNYINEKNIKGKKIKNIEVPSSPIEYQYEGYTILVGKNNIQNDYITHKLAKTTDIWLHAQKIHGSHVIIKKTDNAPISNNIIEFASSLAAFYSKGKDSLNITVDYCQKKYVKKHFSNKPGMVTYTDYNSIYIKPDKHEEYIKKC